MKKIGKRWGEHSLPPLLYGLLTLLLTWPVALNFSTHLAGTGDARNNMWMMWHVKEFFLGHHQLFDMPLLYYPAGVNLLSRGLGPVTGLFALPFWPFGPEAAYNGSLLVGFWLSGYAMYLLARTLGFSRPVSLFAGLMLLASPIHLAGVYGHMTKTFMGLLPLALLTLHHALTPDRHAGWSGATAVVLFLTLFHNGYQFVFSSLALIFFSLVYVWQAAVERRPAILRRVVITASVVILFVGPFVLTLVKASQDPFVPASRHLESVVNQPDLAQFILPPEFTRLWGDKTSTWLKTYGVVDSIEKAVFLSWTGLALCLVAFLFGSRQARPWLLFTLLVVLFATGPSLQLLGQRYFTEYRLTIMMPYALLTTLPGFEFMRASGRFMMIGTVAFAVGAAFGLSWLIHRFPRTGRYLPILAAVLVLLEIWPRPWPQEQLRPVPQIYQQIVADEGLYGVFDLPVKTREDEWHGEYASYYQRYQMIHRKGIASGYLARTYRIHPLFPCVIPEFMAPQPDVLVDGKPAHCDANILYDLAYFNYRYVVWHKQDKALVGIPETAWGEAQAALFVEKYFGDQEPFLEDELSRVYRVPPLLEAAAGLSPTMGLAHNWYALEEGVRRWAKSPATLFISLPQPQQLELQITPGPIYQPGKGTVVGDHGMLVVEVNGEYVTTLAIDSHKMASVPLALPAGVHTISLSLEAGNFRPSRYGGGDWRILSFAIESINLNTNTGGAVRETGWRDVPTPFSLRSN